MASGLNVWVAKPGNVCRVDDDAWRVTVYDAHDNVFQWAGLSYADLPAPNAHWAGTIPPGTYVVRAVRDGGGATTDHAIVTVGCFGFACVLLYVAGARPPDRDDCAIDITGATGLTAGNRVVGISVTGTATKCAHVAVSVSCSGGKPETAVADVQGGEWSVTVNARSLGCRCGGPVSVRARCVEDRKCVARYETDDLPCKERTPAGTAKSPSDPSATG